MARTKPYTVIGIRRKKCARCGKRGYASWQACADDRIYRVMCLDCDIELNELVLKWMGDPLADEKMKKYREDKAREAVTHEEASKETKS